MYGEQTWKNVIMKTSTTINGTAYLEFVGENRLLSFIKKKKNILFFSFFD